MVELHEQREVAALSRRIRSVLSVFRLVAAHMGVQRRNSGESALHLCGRIGAIGRVALAPVAFDGMDLELLVRDELLLCAAQAERFSVQGPEVRLAAKTAELISLAIHELAINAVKYGALAQTGARIEVAWRLQSGPGAGILHFEWLEVGVNMPADAPATPGFGCELIERLLARELRGTGKISFLPDGVCCRIEIPLRDEETP